MTLLGTDEAVVSSKISVITEQWDNSILLEIKTDAMKFYGTAILSRN